MKHESTFNFFSRVRYQCRLALRRFAPVPVCGVFGKNSPATPSGISCIRVINLDRQTKRWRWIEQELRLIRCRNGGPLLDLTERFSAVDARQLSESSSDVDLQATYTLADQLFVEPNPLIGSTTSSAEHKVTMTRQEVAVARSHIELWKEVAASDHPYTLILEDDVVFRRRFAKFLSQAWNELVDLYGSSDAFDLLYLSYREGRSGVEKHDVSKLLYRPLRGLWFLSGYVLTPKGADSLLKLLPVRGPVDLWINQQFGKLDVFATTQSIIDQREDGGSDNSYSILPVLSSVGILSDVNPSVFPTPALAKPVFIVGRPEAEPSSLGTALSMLGYRCCSDVERLPKAERRSLFQNSKQRLFDAYCNVGCLTENDLVELARKYPNAHFILAVTKDGPKCDDQELEFVYLRSTVNKFLAFIVDNENQWETLTEFLGCNAPICDFPRQPIQKQWSTLADVAVETKRKQYFLESDESPWIIPRRESWSGIRLEERIGRSKNQAPLTKNSDRLEKLNDHNWRLLTETFPSNLAIFDPANFIPANAEGFAKFVVRREEVGVRDYTAASFASRQKFSFGKFGAVMRPASVSGLVTGIFLHRNSPRQEIDIEFLGNDTTKLLVNVYYNPGTEGSRFDYGYRGTPVVIDLGFDAAREFHRYDIEWTETAIRWRVDGKIVHERCNWNPTPIPRLPMQFYLNLWPTKSEELAGKLCPAELPASCDIQSVHWESSCGLKVDSTE